MKKHKKTHRNQNTTAREPISKKDRFDVLNRDGFKCRYCGQSSPDVVLHADHVIPVSKGGTNSLDNLVAACSACNGGKSDTEILKNAPLNQIEIQKDVAKYHVIREKAVRYMRDTGATDDQLYIISTACNMIIFEIFKGE